MYIHVYPGVPCYTCTCIYIGLFLSWLCLGGLLYLSFCFPKARVLCTCISIYCIYMYIWRGWQVGGMEFHVHIHVYCRHMLHFEQFKVYFGTMGVHLLICQSTPPLPTSYTIPTQTHMCNICTCAYYYTCVYVYVYVHVCMYV